MTMNQAMTAAEHNDTDLVNACLAGNREAFAQIVARHQSLLCALAYSATGSLTQSEDLAQETFVTAWKHLAELRDAAALRAWLCGILRNLIGKKLRRDVHEPIHLASSLEEIKEAPSPDPLPTEHVINQEEEAILWRSLERIPDAYREPLILYYREEQSVQRVADAMDLTEDAVRQRLSRGRKLLQVQVMALVEGTLKQTCPGKAFTLGVLAALPVMTSSTKAATIGATAAKGGALAKSAGLTGLCGALLGPAFMVMGLYFGYRLDRDGAATPARRELMAKYYKVLGLCILGFFVAMMSITTGAESLVRTRPVLFAGSLIGLMLIYLVVVLAITFWMQRFQTKLRRQDISQGCSASVVAPIYEYRSKTTLLGLPLIHIRMRAGLERGPVKAWFAAGDWAIGVIAAFGGLAIAPISFGGLAAGVLTMGGVAVGALPFGGFSFGAWAVGGMAVGLQAFGGCAIALLGAEGGAAISHQFAKGGLALAPHVNDAVAQQFFVAHKFFPTAEVIMRYSYWFNVIWLLPVSLTLLKKRKVPVLPAR